VPADQTRPTTETFAEAVPDCSANDFWVSFACRHSSLMRVPKGDFRLGFQVLKKIPVNMFSKALTFSTRHLQIIVTNTISYCKIHKSPHNATAAFLPNRETGYHRHEWEEIHV